MNVKFLLTLLATLLLDVSAAPKKEAKKKRRCHYEVLEIPKDASTSAIKRAYRKLALKWHPDKNKDNREEAEIRFREVATAHEVLSDERKRAQYDKFGFMDEVNGMDFSQAAEMFKDMFGNFDIFGNDFGDGMFGDFGDLFGDNEEECEKGEDGECKDKSKGKKKNPFADLFDNIGAEHKEQCEKGEDGECKHGSKGKNKNPFADLFSSKMGADDDEKCEKGDGRECKNDGKKKEKNPFADLFGGSGSDPFANIFDAFGDMGQGDENPFGDVFGNFGGGKKKNKKNEANMNKKKGTSEQEKAKKKKEKEKKQTKKSQEKIKKEKQQAKKNQEKKEKEALRRKKEQETKDAVEVEQMELKQKEEEALSKREADDAEMRSETYSTSFTSSSSHSHSYSSSYSSSSTNGRTITHSSHTETRNINGRGEEMIHTEVLPDGTKTVILQDHTGRRVTKTITSEDEKHLRIEESSKYES